MYNIIGADGNEYGPVSAAVIRQWITEGRANAQTKVLPKGATAWRSLGTLPEFRKAIGIVAAPPVLPSPPPVVAPRSSPVQNQPSGGGCLKAIGIFLIAFGFLVGGLGILSSGDPETPTGMFWTLVLAVTFILGSLSYFRGRQHAARARATGLASPLLDSKPDVLYLRRFQTDASAFSNMMRTGLRTEEEQLADVLKPFGDLIAIGRPGETLPALGASRMYASDQEWQSVVMNRMREAPLIVIRAGVGAGILWEIGQAIRLAEPECVLVLVLDITVNEYSTFADEIRASLKLNLPAIEPFDLMSTVANFHNNPSKVRPGFIRFNRAWRPEFLPMNLGLTHLGYNDLRKSFNVALRPVFESRGVQWRSMGRF